MNHLMERLNSFGQLAKQARDCVLCPRMSTSSRIFGLSSGQISSPLMFIGEAPGRLGADDTSIPFHGDRAGENFERLISQVGISRYECFITNAVLCNPKDDHGNNATPTRGEIANCSTYLRAQIDLIQPRIVVTLGNQALQALNLIEQHNLPLAQSVRQSFKWYGRTLVPLYHPGQRAMLHRSFFNQLSDYRFVAEQLNRLEKRPRKNQRSSTNADAADIVCWLLERNGPISYFRVHKLFYLVEYHYARQHSKRLTSSYVVRQKDGPYFTDLHISKLRKAIPQLCVSNKNGTLTLAVPGASSLFSGSSAESEAHRFVAAVVDRYRSRTDEQLKTAVYLTSPMRKILRQEKFGGANLFNAPINFISPDVIKTEPSSH